MIRLNKRILFYISLFGVSLIAWGGCLGSAQQVQSLEDIVELRYATDTLSLDQIKNIQKVEADSENQLILNLIAWKQTPQKTFENKELAKGIRGDLIEVYGQLDLLLLQSEMIGQQLYEGDTKGAIITEAVAYELWGSSDVIGKNFHLEDEVYTVKGILKEKTPSIIIQVDPKEETSFSVLRMQLIEKGNVEEHLTTLKFKYNLPEGTLNNLSLKSICLSYLALLPGCLLGLYGLLKLYHFIYKTHHYWISALLLSVIALLITWFMMEIIQFSWYIPSYVIPNQWSDFDFWSNLIKKIGQNKGIIQDLPSFLPDRWYRKIQLSLTGSFTLTVVGMSILIRKVKIEEGKELFVSVLVAIVISFISIMLLHGTGKEVWITRAFWGVIPAYLGIDFMITKWRTLLETGMK